MTSFATNDWLDRLGGTWPKLALGYRYEVQLGKMLDEKKIVGNHLRPYLRNVDVQWGDINLNGLPQMDFDEADQARYAIRSGDLLVCEGGEVGRAALWTGPTSSEVYFQKAIHRLRPLDSETESTRFMFYALCAAAESDAYDSGGKATIAHLPAEAFRRVRFPKPPLAEQERIANFLEDKTARIDALIAEKERLLQALGDYESAETSSLLSVGLSGAGSLATGKPFVTHAPAHWRVAAFKRALIGMSQGWSPQCENQPAEDGQWGVLKVGCVNGSRFDPAENKALPPTLQPDLSCVLQKGDVLVSRANTRELVGRAALVEEDYPNLMLCDKLYRLHLLKEWVLPGYAVLLLRSEQSRRQIELGASGASSSMQNISQDVIRELVVALPPLHEQLQILAAAERVRGACASLKEHVVEHLARLREYRSSLISAAVTGQLPV